MSEPDKRPAPERRKHTRISDVFIVSYWLKSPFGVSLRVGDKQFAAVAMDISEGGLGIDLTQHIPVGSKVQVKFKLVNEVTSSSRHLERSFELSGECRYCELTPKQNYRAGVVFTNVTEADREFISVYVKDQMLARLE